MVTLSFQIYSVGMSYLIQFEHQGNLDQGSEDWGTEMSVCCPEMLLLENGMVFFHCWRKQVLALR